MIIQLLRDYFGHGNEDEVYTWLSTKNKALGDKSPIEIMALPGGSHYVLEHIKLLLQAE